MLWLCKPSFSLFICLFVWFFNISAYLLRGMWCLTCCKGFGTFQWRHRRQLLTSGGARGSVDAARLNERVLGNPASYRDVLSRGSVRVEITAHLLVHLSLSETPLELSRVWRETLSYQDTRSHSLSVACVMQLRMLLHSMSHKMQKVIGTIAPHQQRNGAVVPVHWFIFQTQGYRLMFDQKTNKLQALTSLLLYSVTATSSIIFSL